MSAETGILTGRAAMTHVVSRDGKYIAAPVQAESGDS